MKKMSECEDIRMSNFLLKKAAYHYYARLSAVEKELYRAILNAVLNMKESIPLNRVYSQKQIETVREYIIWDRPDIFWFRGECSLTLTNGKAERLEFQYVYTPSQRATLIARMESSLYYKKLDALLASKKTQFEKLLALYEFIIRNTEYDNAAVNHKGDKYWYAHCMDGVLLRRRAVCSGYSKTFQYFANRHGIICTQVTGVAKGGRHAWNLVNLYGSTYYIDPTWGDPTFIGSETKDPSYVCYDFFCITTEQLKKSHQPVFDVPMPLCTETKYNYYCFFKMTADKYSVENVATHLVYAAKRKQKEATIVYTSSIEYKRAVIDLFHHSGIFTAMKLAKQYVRGLSTDNVSYRTDNENYKIIIDLK
ncbi:MAG: hypothetical protein J6K51_01840 [Clostridia bacterium]|nr:hypothetical protein [Clostridia bacterium]